MPEVYNQMHARLLALAKSTYQTSYIEPGLRCLTPEQAKIYYKGFRGPPCFNASDFPAVPPTPPPPTRNAFQLTSLDYRWCLSGKKLDLVPCTTSKGISLEPQWFVGDPETGELQFAPAQDSLCIKMCENQGWSCANKNPNQTSAALRHCSTRSGRGAHPTNYFYATPLRSTPTTGESRGTRVRVKSNDCPELCLVRLAADHNHTEHERSHEFETQLPAAPKVGLATCGGDDMSSAWLRG